MDMWLASRCRCFRGLKQIDLEGRPLCRPINIWDGTEPVPPIFKESLRAFFKGRRAALKIGERFTGEMQ